MDVIAAEAVLCIYVNDILFARLECTPVDLCALTIGYLYTNGWADSLGQMGVPFDIQKNEAGEYEAKLKTSLNQTVRRLEKYKTEKNLSVSTASMMKEAMSCMDFLLCASEAFQETGCIHSAGLFRLEALNPVNVPYYTGEDISRYYAMYKAVGKALLAGENFSEGV